MFLPNKENLVFAGRWRTVNGAIGRVIDGTLTVESCDVPAFIGMRLPIDKFGKCDIHSDFNLEERLRDSEGYMR